MYVAGTILYNSDWTIIIGQFWLFLIVFTDAAAADVAAAAAA